MAEHIYVMELTAPEGQGYTSVHRTQEGAKAKLLEIVNAWGLRDLYDLSEGIDTDASCCADFHAEDGDGITPMFSYGISKLELTD